MCSLCCYKRNTVLNDCELMKETTEEFYKDVSRDTAENLLKNKQNGTFIIRPSKNSNLGTLSLIQDNKMFHLNIRRREDDLITLGTEKPNEKCFQDINSLINYYISNYLVLYSNGEKTLTLLLPYMEKTIC
ncbi:SH2 domain containing protein [Asbolus verrucosus]|uniref:SH2 domain containing protein n=1 Tax=Asbolus verrucosus TaxID=1661398 RepID=A0A482VDT8_ASBVE|nr:SH2 domain containing protein [Asbolus verrucosus]